MRKRHKYGARKTTIDGITFDSQAEANFYSKLKLLKHAGEVIDYQLQPEYELIPAYKKNGRKIRATHYRADFLVTYKSGKQEIIDVKGKPTAEYKLKKKLFEYRYPELEIVEVSA